MNSHPLFAFLLVPLACLGLYSCQTNEQFEQFSPLTSREWQLVGEWNDDTLVTEACQLDDVLSFAEAKEFQFDFGTNFCSAFESLGPRTGSWKFYEAGQALHFRYQENTNRSRVSIKRSWEVEITADTLWLREDVFDEANPGPQVSQRYVAIN